MLHAKILILMYLSKFLPSQRNLSANTIKSYRDTFLLFLIYCQEQEGIKTEKLYLASISDRMILSYLDWIETNRRCCIATRNQRLAAMHAFFRHVQAETPKGWQGDGKGTFRLPRWQGDVSFGLFLFYFVNNAPSYSQNSADSSIACVCTAFYRLD
jgi:hypothetical protein